ncbi:unnamed protein product, partial [Meganyctiphanes norvegica]
RSSEDSGGGSRVHWGNSEVSALIAQVSSHWEDLQGGNRLKKSIWKSIAANICKEGFVVNQLDCDRKWRNLKIRYMTILAKQQHSGDNRLNTRIEYFNDIDSFLRDDPETQQIIQSKVSAHRYHQHQYSETHQNQKGNRIAPASGNDNNSEDTFQWADAAINQLLDLLVEFRDWFRDDTSDERSMWQTVNDQMQVEGHETDPDQCKRKWHSLIQQYDYHRIMMMTKWQMTQMVASSMTIAHLSRRTLGII